MGRWGVRRVGRWGDGEMGRWGDREMGGIFMKYNEPGYSFMVNKKKRHSLLSITFF
ncbi:hypothetical protein [Moorena producens]|uniref:hypothetical protein n=1 Tax=Moorena producens TaxID=1155739 RepID=UPI003C717A89